MFKKLSFLLVFLFIFSFCGCAPKSDSQQLPDDKISDNSNLNNKDDADPKYDTLMYKYIDGYAVFEEKFDNGYVVFKDRDYKTGEDYYGKVRWGDEKGKGDIVSAYQVVEIDGVEVFSSQLNVEHFPDDKRWQGRALYSPEVKVKSDTDKNAECYIKLFDSNDIEYHMMLTFTEGYNHSDANSETCGAAVFVIDRKNNREFFYDDLYKEGFIDSLINNK